jgi:hypothetical protein
MYLTEKYRAKKNALLRLERRAYFGVMYPYFCAL